MNANQAIMELIKLLENLEEVKINKDLLIKSLHDLMKMVGMHDIKLMIINQIKYLLVQQNYLEGHMLHCVLSGNVGVGKTSVSRILANIWTSLNVIKKPTKRVINTDDLVDKLTVQLAYNMEKTHD